MPIGTQRICNTLAANDVVQRRIFVLVHLEGCAEYSALGGLRLALFVGF